MKLTNDQCQCCGQRPATTRIEWDCNQADEPDDPDGGWWSEDWCDECAAAAGRWGEYRSLTMLPKAIA